MYSQAIVEKVRDVRAKCTIGCGLRKECPVYFRLSDTRGVKHVSERLSQAYCDRMPQVLIESRVGCSMYEDIVVGTLMLEQAAEIWRDTQARCEEIEVSLLNLVDRLNDANSK